MNAVSGIFVALVLVFGGGYALDKIYVTVKKRAVEHVQGGTPSLSRFTNQLTCAKFSASGDYITTKCKRAKANR